MPMYPIWPNPLPVRAPHSALAAASAAPLKDRALGSVLGGGGDAPVPETNTAGSTHPHVVAWQANNASMQGAAAQTRSAVPLLVGNDTVHGQVHLKGATIFPHHIGLGCTVRGTLPSYTPAAPSWPAHSLTHAQRWWYY